MKPIPVIILQYGKLELTEACVKSVRAQNVPVEVFIVDGNSPDKTTESLKTLAELADKHIFLEENLGYAAANNVAIRQILDTRAAFFFVLNNDTLLAGGCLEGLLACMEAHPKAAQVCPAVCYPDGNLQAAGGTIREDIFEPQLIGHTQSLNDYTTEEKVKYAPGMAVLIRSEAARDAGLIPEDYFMYAEDVDWSLEFQKKGWEVWYTPAARITHYDSASSGVFHAKKGYYMVRANVMLAKKWLSPEKYEVFVKSMRAKLVRQSVKYARHSGYVRGMWKGFREAK